MSPLCRAASLLTLGLARGTERKSLMCQHGHAQRSAARRATTAARPCVASGPAARSIGAPCELFDWRLDGIVLGNPDMSNTNPTNDLVDGRLEGTKAINVCVQGIASAVNVFLPDKSKTCRLALLDDVFIGLFYEIHVDYFSVPVRALLVVQALYCRILGLIGLTKPDGRMARGQASWTWRRPSAAGAAKSGKRSTALTLNVNIEWVPVKVRGWTLDGRRHGVHAHLPYAHRPLPNAQRAVRPEPPSRPAAAAPATVAPPPPSPVSAARSRRWPEAARGA